MSVNTQPVERQSDALDLDVHSIFYTIQGEGPFSGRPAVFIRLAGCNLQCPFCDTEYTKGRQTMRDKEIADRVHDLFPLEIGALRKPLVVITGGEPFRQNISPLIFELLYRGYDIQIETNGTLAPLGPIPNECVIVCSPKTGKINPVMQKRIDAYKYVLNHESIDEADGLPIQVLDHSVHGRVARPPLWFKSPIYIQPMDTHNAVENQRNATATVDSCQKHGYTLQLQIHKIVGVE